MPHPDTDLDARLRELLAEKFQRHFKMDMDADGIKWSTMPCAVALSALHDAYALGASENRDKVIDECATAIKNLSPPKTNRGDCCQAIRALKTKPPASPDSDNGK